MLIKESRKVTRYLRLLDDARCDGRWQDVDDLAEKLTKHAFHRRCIVLTARTESLLAHITPEDPLVSGDSQSVTLSRAIPTLLDFADLEKGLYEDAFSAKVAAASAHMTLGDMDAANNTLPPNIETVAHQFLNEWGIVAKWTHISIVKAAYIRAMALRDDHAALEACESMLPYLPKKPSLTGSNAQILLWSEQFLTRYCTLAHIVVSEKVKKQSHLSTQDLKSDYTRILKPFRAWAELWEGREDLAVNPSASGKGGEQEGRMVIWHTYYDTLSFFIQHDISQALFESRLQQSLEFKQVESMNERILLHENQFPKADQATPKVGEWIDMVMANWTSMLNNEWSDDDLGSGGRAGLGRSIKEILYRAALRSFHFLKVYRYLFEIHISLCEIDLATVALHQYVEFAIKGRARVEKSGKVESDLDDMATILMFTSVGIDTLCTYGHEKQLQLGVRISDVIEDWLSKTTSEINFDSKMPQAVACAYHAVGLVKSRSAAVTLDTESRPELQESAIECFRSALKPEYGQKYRIRTLYLLSLILATTGDYEGSLASVKEAVSVGTNADIASRLQSEKSTFNDKTYYSSLFSFSDTYYFLKSWAWLAVLMIQYEQYAAALASYEAAFAHYEDDTITPRGIQRANFFSKLGLHEMKGLIELKMSQLSLTSLLEGPEQAINESKELFTLFRSLNLDADDQPTTHKTEVTSTEPVFPATRLSNPRKGLRASIFGAPKDRRVSKLSAPGTASSSAGSVEPPTDGSIRVATLETNDTNTLLPQKPNHQRGFLGRYESRKLTKRSNKKADNLMSRNEGREFGNQLTEEVQRQLGSSSTQHSADQIGIAMTHDFPSAPSASATNPDKLRNPLAVQHPKSRDSKASPSHMRPLAASTTNDTTLAQTDVTSLINLPEPEYPRFLKARHVLAMLCRIWLFIAGLYREASMLTDAHTSVNSAKTLVEALEESIASGEGCTAENMARRGYGGLKSCEELWADVLSEEAVVLVAKKDIKGAYAAFEAALNHHPEHADATIGLSELLLDSHSNAPEEPFRAIPTLAAAPESGSIAGPTPAPANSGRLGARDRAFGLLMAVTKSGEGWNDPRAWYALARAYEASGQGGKALKCHKWVLELERGARPSAAWRSLL